MKHFPAFFSFTLLCSVHFALSPLDYANIQGFTPPDTEAPKLDFQAIMNDGPSSLLDSDYLSERLNSYSQKLSNCIQDHASVTLDKFHNCAGDKYSNIDQAFNKFLSSAQDFALKKFKNQLTNACNVYDMNNCYQIQAAVQFAVMNHQNPMLSVNKIIDFDKISDENPIKTPLRDLKQNFEILNELSLKVDSQKEKVVDGYIQVFKEEGLSDTFNWRLNPFRKESIDSLGLSLDGDDLGGLHSNIAFKSADAAAQDLLDKQDLEKSIVFGAGESVGSNQDLKQVTKDLSPNDIRLNKLSPNELYPIPTADDMKEMARLNPDIVLTSKQKRQLKLVRHLNIV